MLAPVVIFVYNRLEHTIKTIESLKQNLLSNQTEVFIFSDAAKNNSDVQKVINVRSYINKLETDNPFKRIKIFDADVNKGLGNSIIEGVGKIIDNYGKVIVLEDDLITSADFLMYMNKLLAEFENDNRIWSVSGYTFEIKFPKYYDNDLYLSYRGSSWGWGTWKNRWEQVDWELKDYNSFKKSFIKRKKFNRGGRDMTRMLISQVEGLIDSWAIRWCYTQHKLNMYTVYPVKSRIENIGLDGSGTHKNTSKKYHIKILQQNQNVEFKPLTLNKSITRSFKNHYLTLFGFFILESKIIIKKLIKLVNNKAFKKRNCEK